MEEVHPDQAASPAMAASVGEVLRAARDRLGVSLADIGTRTRIPLRHLEAIEADDYSGLPSHTYATGFVKAYARVVGADEVALARRVRVDTGELGKRTPDYVPYEFVDAARVPSRRLTAITVVAALLVILAGVLWYGTNLFRGGGATTSAAVAHSAAPRASVVTPVPAPTPAGGAQVTLSTSDRVWLRVHDGDKTLYTGTMNPGERFDVPADATRPMVDIGRPDKLQVTLNGSALPPLGPGGRAMTDVRVNAEALQVRKAGAATGANGAPGTAPPTTGR